MPPYSQFHRLAPGRLSLLLTGALILSVVALAGCSHEEGNGVQMPPTVTTIDPVTGKTVDPAKTPTLDGQPNPAVKTPPALTATDLGLPLYPGATGGDKIVSTNDGSVTALLKTREPFEKIVAFYKDKMTLPDASGKRTEPLTTDKSQNNSRDVTLSYIAKGSGMRVAHVSESNGETLIELMRLELGSTATGISNLTGGKPAGSAAGGTDLPAVDQSGVPSTLPTAPDAGSTRHTELPTGTRP